jgi:hypothetical protein
MLSTSSASNILVRANSLKAWKEEQEDEKERVKSAKRTKSPARKVMICFFNLN